MLHSLQSFNLPFVYRNTCDFLPTSTDPAPENLVLNSCLIQNWHTIMLFINLVTKMLIYEKDWGLMAYRATFLMISLCSCHDFYYFDIFMFMVIYPCGLALHFCRRKKHTAKMKNLHLLHVHILSVTCGAARELTGRSANKISVMLIYLSPIITLLFVCQYIQAEIMRCFAEAGFE